MTHPTGSAAQLEAIAVEVAMDAAAYVAANRPRADQVDHKSTATDLVTEVDRATEARLIAAIRAHRPGDAFVGEESGRHSSGSVATGDRTETAADMRVADEVEWVLDPIDGTVNFVLGLPAFSVSVAARSGGQVVAGCVVDVSRMDCFHGHLGGGSWLRAAGRGPVRLTGPRPIDLGEAVVATGFGYDAAMRARQGQVIGQLLGRIGNLRRLGSAALDLCLVAAGRVDAYFEAGLNDWDRAAGILIAREAGASVEVIPGRGGELTVAAAPSLYTELVEALRGLGAENVGAG